MTKPTTEKEIKVCSICQHDYVGWGNNAEPVNDGRCCDDCNADVVIRARITQLMKQKAKERA